MPIIISANPQITLDIGNRVLALLESPTIMAVTHGVARRDAVCPLPRGFFADRSAVARPYPVFAAVGELKLQGPPVAVVYRWSPLAKRVHRTVNY